MTGQPFEAFGWDGIDEAIGASGEVVVVNQLLKGCPVTPGKFKQLAADAGRKVDVAFFLSLFPTFPVQLTARRVDYVCDIQVAQLLSDKGWKVCPVFVEYENAVRADNVNPFTTRYAMVFKWPGVGHAVLHSLPGRMAHLALGMMEHGKFIRQFTSGDAWAVFVLEPLKAFLDSLPQDWKQIACG